MPYYEDPDTGEVYWQSGSRRYSIGTNPRARTLIKVAKKVNKLLHQYYQLFRHAGLIKIPHRTEYRQYRRRR